jgi:hypothetical protein
VGNLEYYNGGVVSSFIRLGDNNNRWGWYEPEKDGEIRRYRDGEIRRYQLFLLNVDFPCSLNVDTDEYFFLIVRGQSIFHSDARTCKRMG